MGLAELSDTAHFHDGRLPLPFGRFVGLFSVRINTSKVFPVRVKHSHLPVMVFSSLVFPEYCALRNFHLEEHIMLNSSSANERYPLRVIACCVSWWGQAKSCEVLPSLYPRGVAPIARFGPTGRVIPSISRVLSDIGLSLDRGTFSEAGNDALGNLHVPIRPRFLGPNRQTCAF
jgi:hypothetical protein